MISHTSIIKQVGAAAFVRISFCFFGGFSEVCACDYLIVLQAALCLRDELDVLAGESHQLTVAGSQINILE